MVEIFNDAAKKLTRRGNLKAAIITDRLGPALEEAGLLARQELVTEPLQEPNIKLPESGPVLWEEVEAAARVLNDNTTSLAHAEEISGFDRTYLFRLVQKEIIPSVRIGNHYRVSLDGLRNYRRLSRGRPRKIER